MFVKKVIAEVMHSLLFVTLLPIATSSGDHGKAEAGAGAMFVSLSSCRPWRPRARRRSRRPRASGARCWTPRTRAACSACGPPRPRCCRATTCSCRTAGTPHDSLLTMAVFDAVSALQLEGRALSVFLDTQRLHGHVPVLPRGQHAGPQGRHDRRPDDRRREGDGHGSPTRAGRSRCRGSRRWTRCRTRPTHSPAAPPRSRSARPRRSPPTRAWRLARCRCC